MMKLAEPNEASNPKRGVTLALAMAMLLASLGTSIANIALPALAQAFSASFPHIQGVVVAYLATLTISAVLAGRLGDHFALKPMLVMGLAIFAVASLLCALAPSLWFLIGARALQGIGAAFIMTLGMALMRQTTGTTKIGRAMGLLGTISALGTTLGPSLGGLMLPLAGWRGIFWVQTPLASLALLLALRALPDEPAGEPAAATPLRSVLCRGLISHLVLNILVAAVMMTTLVAGPFFLANALGLEALHVGLVMAVGPAISIVSGVPSGRLVDAWGFERVLAFGLALLAIGAFLLAVTPQMIGLAGYLLSIAILTPGYQIFQAANNTAVLAKFSKQRLGMVSGLLGLSRNIGLIAGASCMGTIFAYGVGTNDIANAPPAAIAAGMRLTFLLAAGMIIVASGIMLRHRAPSAHAP